MLTYRWCWCGIHDNRCRLAGPCILPLGDFILSIHGIAKDDLEMEILDDAHGQGGHSLESCYHRTSA